MIKTKMNLAKKLQSKKVRLAILAIALSAGAIFYFNKINEVKILYTENKVEIGMLHVKILAN